MEHGLLPAEGVSRRVIEALAQIVGESAETIRSSGLTGKGAAPLRASAFARVASPAPKQRFKAARAGGAPRDAAAAAPARDEIDELFTGG